ncbi:SepM family pheromone-processing serine protease [Marininema halotolerans]|uniref:endopeptidase La n=1 Tax=Marininema halotolerans TaxID=1155944 RepID=A0A1I6QGF9_9BACL|nr:SepM family pheromone-processing serine protease [Marininema halotolerans]SFS51492.1 PDZ domain-containing protein [Marininema halotolerans]
MMTNNRRRYRNSWVIPLIAVVVIWAVLFLIPVPYYLMLPGSALDVHPMVTVHPKPSGSEKGHFYLTTVAMRKGNIFGWLAAKVDSTYELIPEKEVLGTGGNSEDYDRRQKEIMKESQQDAVLAAFHATSRPVKEKFLGVKVLSLIKNMPAEKVLHKGDLIKEVDGKPVQRAEELVAYLSGKKIGDKVSLAYTREGKPMNDQVVLGSLPGTNGVHRPGLGIQPVTKREVKTNPVVKIEAGDIGGPSAGLMFSLEIANQLEQTDLTQGYQVAGTGTITPDGKVGQIGGIQHKIVAADDEGAEIFFVPADQEVEDTNQKIARKTVQEIGSKMKLVPVHTLGEALSYLKNLPGEKKGKKAA